MQRDSSEREQLLHRRQFVLTNGAWRAPKGWHRVALRELGTLWIHPELEVRQATNGNLVATCLGFIVDPNARGVTTQQIVDRMVERLKSPRDVFKLTTGFGGRWAILVQRPNEAILFNDPIGLRQIFYTDRSIPEVWCASQPMRISEALHLERTAQLDFFGSNPDRWWPGDSTPWKQVKGLLPNHYLNLIDGTIRRFWPTEPLANNSIEVGAEQGANLLERLVTSAHDQFPLALPITAGYDTRSILAATRTIANDIFFHTLMFGKTSRRSRDVVVPQRLLRKLGLPHHLIRCPDVMDPELRDFHERNTETWHFQGGVIAQGVYEGFPHGYVSVSGFAGEVARNVFRNEDDETLPSPLVLAQRLGLDATPFVLNEFERWRADACGPASSYGIDLWTLFYWEQRSRWVAAVQSQRDLIHESFTPFNCRALLETLLSVPRQHCKPPNYELYREMIRRLWPEVLTEPINPSITFQGDSELLSLVDYPES